MVDKCQALADTTELNNMVNLVRQPEFEASTFLSESNLALHVPVINLIYLMFDMFKLFISIVKKKVFRLGFWSRFYRCFWVFCRRSKFDCG